MSEPIIYVDHSEIRDGKREALKSAIHELVEFVKANEPRILSYDVYWSEETERMSVVHIHPDAASLEFHMKVVGPMFARFRGFITLLSIDVYGDPGDANVALLEGKAELFGCNVVRVHRSHAGFARFG